MEKELLWWIFSTIAQAFVALLALVGMVGIYKMSRLDDLFDSVLRTIERYFPSWDSYFFSKYTEQKDIIDAIDKIIARVKAEGKSYGSIADFENVNPRLKSIYGKKIIFRNYFILFAIITIIDVIASLGLLEYSTRIAEHPYIYPIVTVIIILSLLSLLLALLLVIIALSPTAFKKKIT